MTQKFIELLLLFAVWFVAANEVRHVVPKVHALVNRDSDRYCSTTTLVKTTTATGYVTITVTKDSVTTRSTNSPDVSTTTLQTISTSGRGTTSIDQSAVNSSSARSIATSTAITRSSTKAVTPSSTSEVIIFDGCQHQVPGTGSFVKRSKWSFTGSSLPDGLTASDGPVTDVYDGSTATFNHYFSPDNVIIDNNFLNLLVPGGQSPDVDSDTALSTAEVVTDETNILYASVRTNAIFSSVRGTCHGNFFYASDNAEIDIEYLTDPSSEANNGSPIPIWYTNQPLTDDVDPTQDTGTAPGDVTTRLHEYRVDWTQDETMFYVDGVLQKTLRTNVPDTPGMWVFNNWANGDPSWSVGPPEEDSVFRIKDITMYYNTTTSGSCAE